MPEREDKPMKQVILGTAGHIDHGKTSLIKALTGIDTDRLKEEKLRGITIELGFAHMDMPGGERLGIVDVPGHEKFVKHMVAGATGIDLVALVIAADEGIMPQTREHMEICELLRVKKGLAVLTKTDLVDDPDWLEMVREDIVEFLKGTFLEGCEIIAVSAVTGEGLADLKKSLARLFAEVEPKSSDGPFRLPVDRVFTMRGFGTVITGTSISGRLQVGDPVVIYPDGTQKQSAGNPGARKRRAGGPPGPEDGRKSPGDGAGAHPARRRSGLCGRACRLPHDRHSTGASAKRPETAQAQGKNPLPHRDRRTSCHNYPARPGGTETGREDLRPGKA